MFELASFEKVVGMFVPSTTVVGSQCSVIILGC